MSLRRTWAQDDDSERGSAPVEFVLVSLVLIPLFTGILQLGLFLHVRNTMTMCAHEGARVGANYNRDPGDASDYASDCLGEALGPGRKADTQVQSSVESAADGQIVNVTMHGEMQPLGFVSVAIPIDVQGHAVKEPPP